MQYLIDVHTHTIASGHAYSTMSEMIAAAKEKKLSYYGITEHAPAMPGTCHLFYFQNLKVIPREYDGLRLFLGAEANITDYLGTLDLYQELLDQLDLVIASLHTPCCKPGTMLENTNAYLNAMKNPSVKIIGHPDDGRYPIDYEMLVKGAKENHVVLEVNNSSLSPNSFRLHSKENAMIYLDLCKQEEIPIILGSDAHICYDIANFTIAEEILKRIDFPKELIININESLIGEYFIK